MASLNPLRDISETFCQCSICLEQFKEPKLLPCLHRFCRDCLKSIIQQSPQNHCCPECRKEFSVSEEGADGLKTDFSMKSLIEFIQLQNSLLDVQVADCFGCSRKVSVTAYCFECEDFLCKKCHEYHLISKSLRNHQQHVVDLKEAKSKNFTFEKLVSLKGASRCQIHSGNISELCCVTCHKRPICVACTYGEHKEHDIIDVKTLATGERKKLDVELVKVTNAKEAIYKIPPLLDGMKKEIVSNVKRRKDILHASCDTEVSVVNEKMKGLTKEHKEKYQNINQKREEAIVELEQEMEREIKKIKDRYQQLIKDMELDYEGKQIDLQNIYDKKQAKLTKTLNIAQKDLKDLVSSMEKEQKERLQKINVIGGHFENAIKRYENFQSMASSIVTSTNDWTAVECVPALCSAAEPLLKEMGKEFPELDTLPKIDISNIPTVYVGEDKKGSMTLNDKQLTVFKTNKPDEWLTHDMTTANGIVVISGYASQAKQLNITAIEITDESTFKCNTKNVPKWSWRYGETLSEFKVAAASLPHTIGVYDLNDESHSTRNMCDITKSWPKGRLITSVATNEGKDDILVGGYSSGDIFVFNKQLDYCHTLTLPEWIYWPWDLIVNDDKLYICDFTGQKVSAFTIEGSEAKFLCEFKKPDLDEDCVTPLNMCKDKNGFIYILWKSGTSLQDGKRVIVRYSKVGRQLLTMEGVNDNAACIETVETEGGELLLVMTLTSGILYTYHLEGERE